MQLFSFQYIVLRRRKKVLYFPQAVPPGEGPSAGQALPPRPLSLPAGPGLGDAVLPRAEDTEAVRLRAGGVGGGGGGGGGVGPGADAGHGRAVLGVRQELRLS